MVACDRRYRLSKQQSSRPRLCLASKSAARRRLIRGLLRSSFPEFVLQTCAVDLDERALQRTFARSRGISKTGWNLTRAKALALELAHAKRRAAERKVQVGHWVLGCDQVVLAHGQILGKPESHKRAVEMLKRFSGEKIVLVNAMSIGAMSIWAIEDVQVIEMRFATLSEAEIERVLRLDRPYGAAGSFHFESHGANLLRTVTCDDPTGIQGLPVMRLRKMIEVLKKQASAATM